MTKLILLLTPWKRINNLNNKKTHLDKPLKILGILACITIIFLGMGVAYEVICRIIRTNSYSASTNPNSLMGLNSPAYKGITAVQLKIVKKHRNQDTVILLLNINNTSKQTVTLHTLDIKVVDKAGKLIDKCNQGRNTMDRFVQPEENKTIKIICTDMAFLQQHTGKVDYLPSLSKFRL